MNAILTSISATTSLRYEHWLTLLVSMMLAAGLSLATAQTLEEDAFGQLKTVSVLFNGSPFALTEENQQQEPTRTETPVAIADAGEVPPRFADLSLLSIWTTPTVPPIPRLLASLNKATAGRQEQDVIATKEVDNDIDPSIAYPSSLYTEMVDMPDVQQQRSIEDGNEMVYGRVLDRQAVATTKPDASVNDLFIDAPALDQTPLSLRDVVLYTLKNNPEIGIAFWQTVDARYTIRGAKAPFLPTVDFSGASGLESVYIENSDNGGTTGLNRREATIRLSQRLYDFGRSAQLLKRARALYQARELAFDDTVEDTVLAAVTAYLDLLASTELLSNAKSNVEEHEAIFRLVQINFDGGNTSEAELKRAKTRLDRARTAALDAENRRENAINNFRRVTQLEPGQLIEPELDVSLAGFLNSDTVDSIISNSFSVQSFVRDKNSIQHQLSATKRSYLPELSLDVVGRYQDNVLGNVNGTSEGRAVVSARWNLYDGGLASSRASQLRARERETEQRIIRLRNELREEAFNIISVLETTASKRDIFDEQVDSSQRVVVLYSKQFEAGRRTLLELLDAQADFAEAREESIANKFENLSASFASLRFQNILTPTLEEQLKFSSLRQE